LAVAYVSAGILRDGASIIPLDELPATAREYFIAERYRKVPIDVNTEAWPGRFLTKASIIFMNVIPLGSAFGFVKTI